MSEYNTSEVSVGGHQGSSKVGKIKTVKPHNRSDRKEGLVQPRNKEKNKLNSSAKKSLINGSQTQITGKGNVKKPTTKDLIDMIKESDGNRQHSTPYEARIIDREYKRVLQKLKVLVKNIGGIDKARGDSSYKSLIKQQSRRVKEYHRLIKGDNKNAKTKNKQSTKKSSKDT